MEGNTPQDRDTAAWLLVEQDRSWGTSHARLIGPAAFYLLLELDLFRKLEIEEHDPPVMYLSQLRIFRYGDSRSEPEYEITPEGKIYDPYRDADFDPEEILSPEYALSHWEAHDLIPGFGDVLKLWLERHGEETEEGG